MQKRRCIGSFCSGQKARSGCCGPVAGKAGSRSKRMRGKLSRWWRKFNGLAIGGVVADKKGGRLKAFPLHFQLGLSYLPLRRAAWFAGRLPGRWPLFAPGPAAGAPWLPLPAWRAAPGALLPPPAAGLAGATLRRCGSRGALANSASFCGAGTL